MVQFSLQIIFHSMIQDELLRPYSPDFVAAAGRITAYEEHLRYVVDEGLLYGPQLQDGTGSLVRLVTTQAGLYVSKELKPESREALVFGHGFSPEQVLDHERGLALLNYNPEDVDVERVVTDLRLHQAFMRAHLGDRTILPAATYVVDGSVFRVQPYFPMHSPLYAQDYNFISKQRELFYSNLRMLWNQALCSHDFILLPSELRAYLKAYGIDPGCGDNAGFIGIDNNPPFRLIDY